MNRLSRAVPDNCGSESKLDMDTRLCMRNTQKLEQGGMYWHMLPRFMVFPAAPIHQVAGVRRRVQMSQVSSSYMPPYLHSDSQWNFQSHKLSFADGGRVDSIQEHLWNRRVRPRARRYGRTGFELSTTE